MLFRAHTYLLQPTARQRVLLDQLLEAQRELYNAALEERRGAWRWERRSITRYEQFRTLTELRAHRPDVLVWGVTVARGTLTRLDRAFRAFYQRCRSSQKPGFPRFRGKGRWDSVEYPDTTGWRLDEGARRLHLQGIGEVKLRLHRCVRGTPKTATVRREGRRWWVTVFCANVPARPAPPASAAVGIDRGINLLAAFSDGRVVANPRWFSNGAERLARAQQSLARCKKGSARRTKVRARVAAAHRKIRRQRRDFLHKTSRYIVDGHALIVLERLAITNMTRSATGTVTSPGTNVTAKRGLNRSILDAGWGLFEQFLAYKAEEAGRELLRVDPRHTSQRCSVCGHTAAANRVNQVAFRCQVCGHQGHADVNAAINILRGGLALRDSEKPGKAA